MSVARAEIVLNELLPELTQLENDADRQEFLSRNPTLVRAEVVQGLAPLVVKKIRLDAREALRLAEGAVLIAQTLGEQESVALALRAKANALFACRENRAAIGLHKEAYQIYASRELWKEAAITLNSSIQPLILLGEYEQAFAASKRARGKSKSNTAASAQARASPATGVRPRSPCRKPSIPVEIIFSNKTIVSCTPGHHCGHPGAVLQGKRTESDWLIQ